jgi:anti-sigma factor RsiW
MEEPKHEDSLSDRERSELAAYADGSLPPQRRAAVEERLNASPQLRALVDQQRRAVDAIRAADVPAPARLRARLEATRREAAPHARRRRVAVAAGFGAAAATALALAVTLPGDGAGGPTVADAARLSERPPAQGAPRPSDAGLLAAHVEGVPFPDWGPIRWPATGARTDRVEGRRVTTVFYAREGRVVGYQIISGERLEPPEEARARVIGGVTYHSFTAGGRTIVTWTRAGRTCVVSGRGVQPRVLHRLAAWEPRAA